ncbi:MAG: restriction endonuclease subunit S [Melioribacteraceae bacterium]|jgi:type I restriction enzyme S subunit|nr:restriction endonuclease subunit S [Melioribacteraceae bacterium]
MTDKKNKNIPKLRFLEFSDEWETKKLGEVAVINPPNSELPSEFIYIDLESVENGNLLKESLILKNEAPSRAQRLLKRGDILFQIVRPYQMNNLYFNRIGNYVASTGYAQIRTKNIGEFLFQHLHNQKFVAKVINKCTGTSYPAINSTDLSSITVSFPTLLEQQKIASFLTAVDEKLQALKKKKSLLEQYKKGIMQKFFSQELRFKDNNGNNFPAWEEKKLGDIFALKLRPTPKPNGLYKAIGVRSHFKGTFQKHESDPSKIKMDTLYFVKENDLVVNITFAWEGAVAIVTKSDENGLVSHRFPTYLNDKKQLLIDFFRHLYPSSKFKNNLVLISPGGAGRNRVLKKTDFLKIIFNIPCLPEQSKIANFLSSLDAKINTVQSEIEKTDSWKKGLLQKMFV